MRKNHTKKVDACIYLVGLKKKHVYQKDIQAAADKFALSYGTAERAWKNFTESGGRVVDRRDLYHHSIHRTLKGNEPVSQYLKEKAKPRYGRVTRFREVSFDEAKAIISEYMATGINSRELSTKYNISINQFYDWLRELEVKGTLLGNKILDTQKYAKVSVVDAVWLKKKPKSKRYSIAKLSYTEKEALSRVGDILEIYLK